jgi:hypothetical protein
LIGHGAGCGRDNEQRETGKGGNLANLHGLSTAGTGFCWRAIPC